jgi:hypothetical protein
LASSWAGLIHYILSHSVSLRHDFMLSTPLCLNLIIVFYYGFPIKIL